MNISKDEYEQRRQIFDSYLWIQQKLNLLQQESNFEENYFEQKGDFLKKILEEAIPVCRLGLYFCTPWSNVFVRYITNTEPSERDFDAVLEIESLGIATNKKINIEVTSTQTDKTAMIRQALSRNGFANFTGEVKRDGRQITTKGEFVDVEEEKKKLVKLVIQRIETKLKNSYDETTAILVHVNSFRNLRHLDRHTLIDVTRNLLDEKKSKIYGIFFCYDFNLGIDGIIKGSPYSP